MSDGYLGSVPEGRAAEEAEDLLAPPVVAARRRYNRIIECEGHTITEARACSKCGGTMGEIQDQRAYLELTRASRFGRG